MQTTNEVQFGDGTTTSASSYTLKNPSYDAEKGWECPRCGRINAPWVRQCDCSNNWNRPNITWTYPGKDSHEDWWKTHVTCEQADANTYTTAHNPIVGGSDYWDNTEKIWSNVLKNVNNIKEIY